MFGPLVRAVEDEELMRRGRGRGRPCALGDLRPLRAAGICNGYQGAWGCLPGREGLVQDAFMSVWRAAREHWTPAGRVSRPGSTRSPRNRAVDLNRRRQVRPFSAGEEPLGNGSPFPAALNPREEWTVGTSQGRSRASPTSTGSVDPPYFEGLSQRRSTAGQASLWDDQEPDHGRTQEAPPEHDQPSS